MKQAIRWPRVHKRYVDPFGARWSRRTCTLAHQLNVMAHTQDRIELLTMIVPSLSPASQLHHIPSLLPEAVLATKEVSEKARTAAFDLLVVMGNKMTEEGGVVKRNLVDGMAAMDLDVENKEGGLFDAIRMSHRMTT